CAKRAASCATPTAATTTSSIGERACCCRQTSKPGSELVRTYLVSIRERAHHTPPRGVHFRLHHGAARQAGARHDHSGAAEADFEFYAGRYGQSAGSERRIRPGLAGRAAV